jgi:hypothetical protein
MGNITGSRINLSFKIIDDKPTANQILVASESRDFYIEECYNDRSNSVARKECAYAPNTIVRYEKETYEEMLRAKMPQIPRRLKGDLGQVLILNLMPSAEGGMPHTRPPNVICYPDISRLSSTSTLIHELWHVHQRKYNNVWREVFKGMGWVEWVGELPNGLEKYRRYNPDTIDCPLWIYRGKWVPVPIFQSITQPKISEITMWFYHPLGEYHVTSTPSELALSYHGLPLSAYENPREITAYMLSEPDKYRHSTAFEELLTLVGNLSITA